MTTKDRTRQKLVGSMRKTKAVAGIGTENTETETIAADTKVSQPGKPAAAKAGSASKVSRPEPERRDSYQSGRRIWPD